MLASQRISTQRTIIRRRKAATDRAISIGPCFDHCNFFAIHIDELDFAIFVGKRMIIIFTMIIVALQRLKADRLPGTIDGAVCEKIGIGGRLRFFALRHLPTIVAGQLVFTRASKNDRLALRCAGQRVFPLRIGFPTMNFFPWVIVVARPQFNFCILEWFACESIDDKSGIVARCRIRNHHEIAAPHVGLANLIFLPFEIGARTRNQSITSKRHIDRSLQFQRARKIIVGRCEIDTPFFHRGRGDEGIVFLILDAEVHLRRPLDGIQTKPDLVNVAIGRGKFRASRIPHALSI